MPRRLSLKLEHEERQELLYLRDHDPKPYVRERAAALLKIADGQSPHQVSQTGLLKARAPDTVYDWYHRYQAEGTSGLRIRPGRGRKPAFFPQYHSEEEAKQAFLHLVRRDPRLMQVDRLPLCSSLLEERFLEDMLLSEPNAVVLSDLPSPSRWSLQVILDQCAWLQLKSLSGLSQLLKRLGISYKRGRSYIHSPDPHYQAKRDQIALGLLRAWYAPEAYVLLYQDEFSYYRQPTHSYDYEAHGSCQPLARRSSRSDTCFRGMGALNAVTGQVTYQQASKTTIPQLNGFYRAIRQDYPHVQSILLVQDNWPVHFHPDVLAYLEPQTTPFPMRLPDNWSTQPSLKVLKDSQQREPLPIQILPLPTYASWCNPIEKLWRWVRQRVLHHHRLSDEWQLLKQEVSTFMQSFSAGSEELLRYVGLLPD